jgi:hypothetical protein
MIRPIQFGYNAETAVNNAFQVKSETADTQSEALKEFDDFVSLLKAHGVDVLVVEDSLKPYTPDSIFPNNWVSFHGNGKLLLYPMFAANRRAERKEHVLEKVMEKFEVNKKIDLSVYEADNLFLEGTGSMVLDREKRIAYACISPRTSEKVLADFCLQMHYEPVVFNAVGDQGHAIYHTNVMMCVADKYVVICADAIPDKGQKSNVLHSIEQSGKKPVLISPGQMNRFAGNMLQLKSVSGKKLLVMSDQAYDSLLPGQVKELAQYNEIIHSPLTTIERNGGGSARCMIAEIHLPLR